MRRGPWTKRELAALRKRYAHELAADIARDLGRPISAVYARARELGLSKSHAFIHRPTGGNPSHRPYTAAEDATIRRRYPHEDTATLAAEMGRTKSALYGRAQNLGVGKTREFVESHPNNRRLAEFGRANRYPKGHVPANKGLRRPGWHRGRMRETQFKKGDRRPDTLELGGMRLESKQKVWLVKVAMSGPIQHRYKPLARIVWERERGPIPPKHCVRITGWDTANPEPPEAVTIDRLECITLAENCRRNSFRNNYPKEVVRAIEAKAALVRAINKREKRHGRRETRHKRASTSSIRNDQGSPQPAEQDGRRDCEGDQGRRG